MLDIFNGLGPLNIVMGLAYFYSFLQSATVAFCIHKMGVFKYVEAATLARSYVGFFFASITLVTLTVSYQHFFHQFGDVVYVWRAGLACLNCFLLHNIRRIFLASLRQETQE